VYPKDPIAHNNLASLGLLLGEDTGQASKLAEEVYSEEPSVSAFAATYAFSLMRAHQPEKALQVLQKLPQTAMADASIGLSDGGGASPALIDQSHFTEEAVWTHYLERLAANCELYFARLKDIHCNRFFALAINLCTSRNL
jgi:hypothetical protein